MSVNIKMLHIERRTCVTNVKSSKGGNLDYKDKGIKKKSEILLICSNFNNKGDKLRRKDEERERICLSVL